MDGMIAARDSTLRITFPHLTSGPAPKARKQAQSTSGAVVDTFGWDTVFAIRLPDVNRAIAKAGSSPTSYRASRQYGSVNASIDGTFGTWAVTQGGSGSIVYMTIPLPSGTLEFEGTYPYVDAVATISVHLEYVPLTPTDAKSGTPTALRVKSLGSGQEKPVTVENLVFNGTQPNGIVGPFLRDMLEDWFAANMMSFQHTFSVVSLNAIADNHAFQWLKPTSQGYAYAQPGDGATDNDCILAVLCMTGGRSAAGLAFNTTTAMIPTDGNGNAARAGFVISGARYLQDVLLPALPQAFSGATAADFAVVAGTTTAKNINAVTMTPLKGYTPHVGVGDFEVELKAGELVISLIDAHVPISPGIDLYLTYTIHAGCRLQVRSDGTQALVMYDTQDIDYHHETEIAAWVTVTEVIAGLIAGIILAGVGSSAGNAAKNALVEAGKVAEESFTAKFVKWLIAAVIGGIVGGIVGSIASIIEANAQAKADDLPAFDPFAQEAVSTTNWSGAGEAVVTSAVFNNGLQLGIDPKFAE